MEQPMLRPITWLTPAVLLLAACYGREEAASVPTGVLEVAPPNILLIIILLRKILSTGPVWLGFFSRSWDQ